MYALFEILLTYLATIDIVWAIIWLYLPMYLYTPQTAKNLHNTANTVVSWSPSKNNKLSGTGLECALKYISFENLHFITHVIALNYYKSL